MLPADAGRVSEIIASAVRAHFPGHYTDEVAAALISRNRPEDILGHAPKQLDYVCEHDSRIVAMIGIKKNEIGHLFVDPAAEGLGIGRHLVEFAVADIRSRGYADLFVLSSLNAVGFYERCGFAREKGGSFDVLPGLPLPYVRMGRTV